MWVNEGTFRVYRFDAVAAEVEAQYIDLLLHHVTGSDHKVAHGDVLLDGVGIAMDVAFAESGKV